MGDETSDGGTGRGGAVGEPDPSGGRRRRGDIRQRSRLLHAGAEGHVDDVGSMGLEAGRRAGRRTLRGLPDPRFPAVVGYALPRVEGGGHLARAHSHHEGRSEVQPGARHRELRRSRPSRGRLLGPALQPSLHEDPRGHHGRLGAHRRHRGRGARLGAGRPRRQPRRPPVGARHTSHAEASQRSGAIRRECRLRPREGARGPDRGAHRRRGGATARRTSIGGERVPPHARRRLRPRRGVCVGRAAPRAPSRGSRPTPAAARPHRR